MLKFLRNHRRMIGKLIKYIVAIGSLTASTFFVGSCTGFIH